MKKETNDILTRLLEGEISDSEMERLADLLDTRQGEASIREQMDAVLEKAETRHCLASTRTRLDAVHARLKRRVRYKRLRHFALRSAAVLVPLFLLGSLLWLEQRQTQLFSPAEYAEVVTAKGERTQVVFQDGTRVFLNAGSRLRYPVKFGLWNRKVYLDGEAYFDVRANKSRPFVVEIEKAAVRVTGTSFDVYSYSDKAVATVTLDEGRVELVTSKATYSLLPSQQIRYDRDNDRTTIVELPATQRLSLWKNDIIAFDRTPLREVIETLDLWYDAKFVVKDPEVYKYAYTFTSDFVPLETLLSDLELLAPVKFAIADDRIEVYVK